MRDYRHLPPLLRMAGTLGLVPPLVSCALWVAMLPTKLLTSDWPADFTRVSAIALNLTMLGLSFTIVTVTYNMRARQPERAPLPLASWQSQVRTVSLLTALPLCALAWVVLIPQSQPGFGNVFLIFILAACVLGGVCIWVLVKHHEVN